MTSFNKTRCPPRCHKTRNFGFRGTREAQHNRAGANEGGGENKATRSQALVAKQRGNNSSDRVPAELAIVYVVLARIFCAPP
jgi:hypothetical protein